MGLEESSRKDRVMAVCVNTNVSSLSGQRYLNNATNSLTTTYQRLSSGLRINSAKDDAAGLQISDRLTSQVNGLNQGNRNANDGIAFAQTAEGALDEISSMFQKVRTLAVQANNGTNTAEDKKAIATEMGSLLTEVQRISNQTTYGGKTILNGLQLADGNSIFTPTADAGNVGKAATMTFQVGANAGDTIDMTVEGYNISILFSAARNAAGGKFKEANFKAFDDLANVDDKQLISYAKAEGQIVVNLNVDTAANADGGTASDLINIIDAMIAQVDGTRANLGAMQNRLESSIRNQSNTSANEADARSRIRDADFAEESANLSQQSIIQQAATSMLMQANTRPQLGLSLLG